MAAIRTRCRSGSGNSAQENPPSAGPAGQDFRIALYAVAVAEPIRANRKPVPTDNPLLAMEHMASEWITSSLDAAAAARDTMEEQMFLSSYGSHWLQALMGFGPDAAETLKHADHDVLREANEARVRAELESQFEAGGLAEAVIRALIYIRLPENSIDERGYSVAKAVRDARL